jgi:hypothetical protein
VFPRHTAQRGPRRLSLSFGSWSSAQLIVVSVFTIEDLAATSRRVVASEAPPVCGVSHPSYHAVRDAVGSRDARRRSPKPEAGQSLPRSEERQSEGSAPPPPFADKERWSRDCWHREHDPNRSFELTGRAFWSPRGVLRKQRGPQLNSTVRLPSPTIGLRVITGRIETWHPLP